MSINKPMNRIYAALIAGCLSSVAFAQTNDPTAAPVTHADKKAAKEQANANKKASVAQAKADKTKADAQADADKANADANLKDAKKQ
jgi:opacity protein-like surface antigen